MYPTLLDLGFLSLPSYYTLLTLGFMTGTYLAWRECPRIGVDPDDFLDMSLYALIAGLLGARLLHVLADGYFMDYVHLCTDPLKVEVPSFIHVKCANDAACVAADAGALCHPDTGRCHPARDCLSPIKFWAGGLAFYGSFISAVPLCAWFMRSRKMPIVKVLDLAGWAFALGQAFGRTGCLLSGCCFGKVSEAGLRFKGYVANIGPDLTCPKNYDRIKLAADQDPTLGLYGKAGDYLCAFGRPAFMKHAEHGHLEVGSKLSLPVHATQAYEAGMAALLFCWLYFWRRKHQKFGGQVFGEYVLGYAVIRFIIEFFRADDRGLWFGDLISTSQLIAVPLFMGALYFLVRGHRLSKDESASSDHSPAEP